MLPSRLAEVKTNAVGSRCRFGVVLGANRSRRAIATLTFCDWLPGIELAVRLAINQRPLFDPIGRKLPFRFRPILSKKV
jgi:hypothetical protein